MKRLIVILSSVLVFMGARESVAQITRSFTAPVEVRLVAANQPDVVSSMAVKEGSLIEAGGVIAELDNSVLRKQLQIAKLRAESSAAIESAKVELKTIEQRVEKLQSMLGKGHANPAEVEKAESELQSASAELELASEKKREFGLEVERIEAEIERNVIRSPIDGVVTEVHVHPGEFIASNERKLATVVRLDKLRVRFYLLEKTTSRLTIGQKVTLRIGEDSNIATGHLEFVSPVIDPDSGTSRVDVLIANKENLFRSGSICYWVGEFGKQKTVSAAAKTEF